MGFSFNKVSLIYDLVMRPVTRKPIEFLKLLNAQSGDKILDIGAGSGRISKYFTHVKELFLLDPAEKMIRKAKKLIPHAKIVVGSSEKITFSDNFFNKIVSYDSLHHWKDQYQGLLEVYRVLKPKGRFVICEVDPSNFWGSIIQFFERLIGMNSIMYKPQDLDNILKFVGFQNIIYDQMDKGLAYCLSCTK